THTSQKMLVGNFLGHNRSNVLLYDFFEQDWAAYEWDGSFLRKYLIGSQFPLGVFDANFRSEDPVFAGDFDGDGLSDVLYYKASSNTWWVGLNTGSFNFNVVPFAQTPQLGDSSTATILTGRFHVTFEGPTQGLDVAVINRSVWNVGLNSVSSFFFPQNS